MARAPGLQEPPPSQRRAEVKRVPAQLDGAQTVPAATGVHVPIAEGSRQLVHGPAQVESQQTPETQAPETHS